MIEKYFDEIEPGIHIANANHPIKKVWALNDKYPDYVTCVKSDNLSEPHHDIDACKLIFISKLEKKYLKKLDEINNKAQEAEETNDDKSYAALIKKRKLIKQAFKDIDLSDVKSIDELLTKTPKILEENI